MSSKLRKKSNPVGNRVPTHLLETAIRWEAFREYLSPILGMAAEGKEAGALKRNYERRLSNETDLH